MRKLALSDEILMTVEKPSRYIGNEINMIEKDINKIDIRFAICFPDVYEIGMSHLGIQILYGKNSAAKEKIKKQVEILKTLVISYLNNLFCEI